ncbi:M23 family metallopeptidase [Ornithinibacillus bavariensis]|uniref:Peptidase M23 n=1 Tax=Ornithinibacillus bavariensis TaxID=545502 RepID=A0A919XCR8_9BACI|nr:M23 family metallopeptidase [Ornithinibacillus bavariensis]GIO28265.1 peptidase M23 [Ornithinibacillus bavariensis]
MKGKSKRKRMLTFTILSNDAREVVTRFRIRRGLMYTLFALPIVPVMALIYFVSVNLEQKAEIDKLSDHLRVETSKSENLEKTVSTLEKETGQTKERLEELTELEKQMRSYMDELPNMVDPSGGLLVLADETSLAESTDGLTFLPSTELLERYKDTIATMDEVSGELATTPTAWPTNPNVITSDFGGRNDPLQQSASFHTGVDIRGYYGTPVYATADGVVTLAKYYGSYGNAIQIKHSGTYQTLYGHLMEIDVEVGDKVKKGDIIGSVGSTGRSTGPHLHYEVIINGKPVDPKDYFNIYGEFDIE